MGMCCSFIRQYSKIQSDLTHLSDYSTPILKRGELSSSSKSTLVQFITGFRPSVVKGIADLFEVESRVFQEEAARRQVSSIMANIASFAEDRHLLHYLSTAQPSNIKIMVNSG